MGLPNLKLLDLFVRDFHVETFIETGSGRGATIEKAIKLFPKVYSVELNSTYFAQVKSRYGGKAHCEQGKAVDFLRKLLPQVHGQAVYWLDAHYSGPPSSGEDDQCNVLEEIAAVNERPGNDDFIMVDDAHIFFSPIVLRPPWKVDQHPEFMQIMEALGMKDRYTFVLMSWVLEPQFGFLDDAFISVPWRHRTHVSRWLKAVNMDGYHG